ncbi:response regulator [Ornithinicoccus halotolerans]|uniref:response regulator n=1 Tax=Ornithinicoccus halotolerans TaxID=1748220 RepID=UPI001297E33F|nr:response regulator transcription factor [Ornithinicoccus halotolerans]
MTIRILLVDDQQLVRAGFRSILEKQPDLEIVAEAGDGLVAVRLAHEQRPDLVLMDVRMPVCDGLVATRQLLQLPNPPVVVVLTTFDADEYVYDALRAGAAGFLLKDTSPEDLIEAVRMAMTGAAMLSPGITRRLIEAYVTRPNPAESPAALATVSKRELDVLRLLAAGRTNTEIAAELYVAESTVKSHVARLLQKLDLRDRVQAVVFAYENGIARPGE